MKSTLDVMPSKTPYLLYYKPRLAFKKKLAKQKSIILRVRRRQKR